MKTPVPDIINLDYPMFKLTKDERAILTEVEAFYLCGSLKSSYYGWSGLCYVIGKVRFDESADNLLEKISESLGQEAYLHSFLKHKHPELKKYLNEVEGVFDDTLEEIEIKNYLRLVWITKLLNQDLLC